jgi:hypothetical protein
MNSISCRYCTVLLAVSALAFLGTPAWADHAWGNYHWERSSNPVTIELGDNVDSRWDGWLAEASSDWSVSSVLETPVASGRAKGNCRPNKGRVEVCNDSYGDNGWLGIAQIWVSGDHIVKAVAKMNDTYHETSPYNRDGWRDMVICQEVGHTFGLAHQDESFSNGNLGTCMDYTSNPDGPPANRAPDHHDFEVLESLYGHLDGSGSEGGNDGCKGPAWRCQGAGAAAPPAFDMELPEVGQWGRMISVARDGGQSVFMQDFGRGFHVYTHVTWTLETAEDLAGHGH